MARLAESLQGTLQGNATGPAVTPTAQPLGQAAPTAADQPAVIDENDPEVQRVRALFATLQSNLESGALKLRPEIQKMFEDEASKIQAEETPAAPSPLQAAGVGLGAGLAQAFGQPQLAESALGTLESRRREALAGNLNKVGMLRDLRQQELRAEADMFLKQGDTASALKKEEELAALQTKMDKEARQRAEKAKEEERTHELRKIGLQNQGRENVVRLRHDLKLDDLEKAYNVPKHVAQMMSDRRKSISSSTDALIRSLGGLGMIDDATFQRLQAEEAAKQQASDEAVLQQYKQGALTPGATPSTAPAPGAGSAQAPAQSERDQKIARMRARVKKG